MEEEKRVSKKRKKELKDDKTKKNNALLKELSSKFPGHSFKITNRGNLKRKFNATWLIVCKHNLQLSRCKDKTCEGGGGLCDHDISRSECKNVECKGGGAICEHGVKRNRCKKDECIGGGNSVCKHKIDKGRCFECGGSELCKHKRVRSHCSDESCNGGGSLCEHKILRTLCRDENCEGGGSYCKHNIRRTLCGDPECDGGGSLCTHSKVRSECRICGTGFCIHNKRRIECSDYLCGGGSLYCTHGILKRFCPDPVCDGGNRLCIICYVKVKKEGDFCTTCHPDYVPGVSGASKIGCEFICKLQNALGKSIQHSHYNNLFNFVTKNEFRLPEYKNKTVDGYYIDYEGHRIVIEFLGDIYHGHPSKWGSDEQNEDLYGRLHKDNFNNTERVFTKVASFGYIIRYVWESDYKKLKALQSPLSILREFKGKLEY